MKLIDIVVTLAVIAFVAMTWTIYTEKDDSDAPDKRSGLTLHTDNLTGCQYFSRLFGGVTPRLDRNGKHLGCK